MADEKILLLTKSRPMIDAVANHLDPKTFELTTYAASRDHIASLSLEIETERPSILFIDSILDETEARSFDELSQLSLIDLRQRLKEEVSLPTGLLVLNATIRYLRESQNNDTLIMFFVDGPSSALTQEVLRLGADWVWTHRLDIDRNLEQVVHKLRQIVPREPKSVTSLPKILVVEDDGWARNRIEAEIESDFDVVIVGQDKAADSFSIEPDEAIAAFKRDTYEAVIVDLVLNREFEQAARERYLKEESSLELFVGNLNDEGRLMAFSILQGLAVIKGIRELSSDVPIIAFSNYVFDASTINVFNVYLGKKLFDSITSLEKGETQFRVLRQLLHNMVAERVHT